MKDATRTQTDNAEPGHDELPRDSHFNPWRTARSQSAKSVVRDILNQLQNYESYRRLRKRSRKADDQVAFEATVEAVICDLIHRHLAGDDGAVSITRSNSVLGRSSRYRPPAYGKTLPDVLDRLSTPEMAFVEQELGQLNPFSKNRRTTIKAGKRLITRITDYGLGFDDLGQSVDQEVIILKRPKQDFWDNGAYQEYGDDDNTNRLRGEVRQINAWLGQADIFFDDAVAPERIVDANDRWLRRIFTRGQFNSSGRLFGGFWQPLKKIERFSGIEINGEQVVELDYGQMAPTIIYGMANAELPAGDLYAIPGQLENRPAIKKLMNAMTFADGPISRAPKGLGAAFGDNRDFIRAMSAIRKRHGGIDQSFFKGIGHEVQFIESNILVSLLLRLKDQDIVALPIHDAILVPQSKAEVAQEAMKSVFTEHAGKPIKVSVNE